jgi:hypothetical protein
MIESPSGAQWWSPFRKRAGRSALAELVAGVLAVVVIAPSAKAAPGAWTQAQVNASIMERHCLHRHPTEPEWQLRVSVPVTETGMGLVAYSVLANGDA